MVGKEPRVGKDETRLGKGKQEMVGKEKREKGKYGGKG